MKEGKRKRKKKKEESELEHKDTYRSILSFPSEGRTSQFLIPLYADGAGYDFYRTIEIARRIQGQYANRWNEKKDNAKLGEKNIRIRNFLNERRDTVTHTNVSIYICIYEI